MSKAKAEAVDMINAPPHYRGDGKVECIDALEAQLTREELIGFFKGAVVKYLWRAKRKGSEGENYAKALWFLTRLNKLFEGKTDGC